MLRHPGKQKGIEMKLRTAGDELLAELSRLFETRRGVPISEAPELNEVSCPSKTLQGFRKLALFCALGLEPRLRRSRRDGASAMQLCTHLG